MSRKYIDCREYPSEMQCMVAFSADSDQELLEAAVQHAVTIRKYQDTPEFRSQLKRRFKEGHRQLSLFFLCPLITKVEE